MRSTCKAAPRIVRLFIAINIPAAERHAIRVATAAMREAAPHVSWVTEDHLHITLKFLGEQPDSVVDSLRAALSGVARAHRAPRLELGGVGAFPNLRAPRVVWLGVEQDGKLELLHHDIESACEALGHDVEGRVFRPHITLGRVRRELGREQTRTLASAARAVTYAGVVEATSIDLMESQLTPSGPRYMVRAEVPLGGR